MFRLGKTHCRPFGSGISLTAFAALALIVTAQPLFAQLAQAEVDECKNQLTSPDVAKRITALVRLGGIAATARTEISTKNEGTAVLARLRQLGPDVAKLKDDPDPRVRAAVMDTLAKIRAEGPVLAPILRVGLNSAEPRLRQLAIDSVGTYFRRSAADIKGAEMKDKDANDPVADDVTRYTLKAEILVELAKDSQALIPIIELALREPVSEIRSAALDAVADFTSAWSQESKPGPQRDSLGDVNAPAIAAEIAKLKTELQPIAEKLQALQPALSVVIEQGDAALSEKTAVTFERLMIYESWFRRIELLPQGDVAADALHKAIEMGIPALTIGLRHSSADVRIASANALDTLGPSAIPAHPQMMQALQDCNVFVRWIAARSLGHIRAGKVTPEVEKSVILALGEATREGDEDARRVALKTLEGFGPRAAVAVPLFGPALENDNAEVQTQALKALDAIGPMGKAALPFLLTTLKSPEARVRRLVPAIIAKYGPDAKVAIPALGAALLDDDLGVQQEAAKALMKLQK